MSYVIIDNRGREKRMVDRAASRVKSKEAQRIREKKRNYQSKTLYVFFNIRCQPCCSGVPFWHPHLKLFVVLCSNICSEVVDYWLAENEMK